MAGSRVRTFANVMFRRTREIFGGASRMEWMRTERCARARTLFYERSRGVQGGEAFSAFNTLRNGGRKILACNRFTCGASVILMGGTAVKIFVDWDEFVAMAYNSKVALSEAKMKFLQNVQDRFQIEEVLGSGGFAKVYKAHDKKSNNRAIALKVMLKENPECAKVMEDEVAVMVAAGTHENLVSLHDIFETQDAFYLVLDLADGGALFDRVLDEGTLTEAQASSYILQVTQALLHLHRRKIVHADMKPENLLLTSADPHASIKLCDFGMARKLEGEGEWFGDKCGTLDYWSPELVRKQPCGTPVDMWALGCVLYIMLCGCNPFNPYGSDPDAEILANIAKARIDTSNPLWKHLSAPCKDFILRLMCVDISKRLTAEEALQHPWLSGAAPAAHLPELHKQRLKGYQALTKLRVAVQALAINADTLFDLLDQDRSGCLDEKELCEAFNALGVKLSQDALRAVFEFGDVSRDGRISRKEFQLMVGAGNSRLQPKELGEEQLRHLFEIFDTDKDGTISPEEMQHVLNMLGRKMTLRRATSIVSKAHSGKGEMKLNFQQFCKIMRMNILLVPVDD